MAAYFASDRTARRILIVDQSADNREVLRTVLQRQGCEIFEARGDQEGLRLASQIQPQVLVLDLDTINIANEDIGDELGEHVQRENAKVVLLGKLPALRSELSHSDVLPKPYHYAPLVRKIEEMLQESD